jgi:hypothetical protein
MNAGKQLLLIHATFDDIFQDIRLFNHSKFGMVTLESVYEVG